MDTTSKQETIANLVEGLPRLRVYDEEISKYEDKKFISTIPVADKNTYLGIEVETENVQLFVDTHSPYWRITEDGSLRNSGREFVSIPIKAFRVENALDSLFKSQINPDIEFTERTSIHIHMNVRTMTVDQLKAMILLYLLFERALFRYVDKDRYNNIFCVPLNETSFGERLTSLFDNNRLHLSWTKYTALNLLPIFEKGTIEFRHLHGTKDIPEILGWINLILCLKKMALRTEPNRIWETIKTLNTSSQYHSYASEVFGEYITLLNSNTLEKDIGACCTYIKTKCLNNKTTELIVKEIEKDSIYSKMEKLLRYYAPTQLTVPPQPEEEPRLADEELEEDIPTVPFETAMRNLEIRRQQIETQQATIRTNLDTGITIPSPWFATEISTGRETNIERNNNIGITNFILNTPIPNTEPTPTATRVRATPVPRPRRNR